MKKQIKYILIIVITFLFMMSNYSVKAYSSIVELFENVYSDNEGTSETTEFNIKDDDDGTKKGDGPASTIEPLDEIITSNYSVVESSETTEFNIKEDDEGSKKGDGPASTIDSLNNF